MAIKDSYTLLLKFCTIPKKANSSLFYFQAVFLLVIVFALSASSVAQSVDYNLPKNWMCHPILKSTDVARQQKLTLMVKNPDMSTRDSINYTRDTLVDIFYIYPTIDMNFQMGNTLMDSIDTLTAQYVYREQVGIYAQFGRVFAPYYRQATIGVFVTHDTFDSLQLLTAGYMKKAYDDIDSAFSHYLKYYNKGRKIILIGHSQGADHERFLLRNKFDNNPVLQSQLVVAISGGEPNYASTSGSRTGGSLQNIKTCPPRDSVQECGCVINWRTWNENKPLSYLNKTSFYYNQHFVDSGLIYKIYDTVNHSHMESYYDFGYTTHKTIPRYITLDSTMTNYLAFDGMFRGKDTTSALPGSSYLLIDSIFTPNDHRKTGRFPHLASLLQDTVPIPQVNNYHIWDMQFVQNDLLQIIPGLIAITHPINSVPEIHNPDNELLVYPNPTTGIVHVSAGNEKIKSIKLYDLQGAFVDEFFTNDFSVLNLAPGNYILKIQTKKSILTSKFIKQ
jgi:hypothetical protein